MYIMSPGPGYARLTMVFTRKCIYIYISIYIYIHIYVIYIMYIYVIYIMYVYIYIYLFIIYIYMFYQNTNKGIVSCIFFTKYLIYQHPT